MHRQTILFARSWRTKTGPAWRVSLSVGRRLIHRGARAFLNLNCWNEWTEGSYLEPDTVRGLAYLEAVKAVFGDGE